MIQVEISAFQSDHEEFNVPNRSPILSREEQEQKDFELAMQLSQEDDFNVGGRDLSILNVKPSDAFADSINMNNSIEERSPPKKSSNQINQQPCTSSASLANNFESRTKFENNDDYVDFSDNENFTQNSPPPKPKSHPYGKHDIISIDSDSDSDEENKKLFKRLAKFSSSSDNDEEIKTFNTAAIANRKTKPMTMKNGGTNAVIAGTSKSKLEKPANAKKTLQEILAADSVLSGSFRFGTKNGSTNAVIAGTSKSKKDPKVEKPPNAKKTLQEILAADSVLSGSRYGTKKRKQKTETINSSSSDDDEDNTNGTNTKNKKKKLKSGSPKKYMPKPGSGGYAILIALYENESSDNSEGFLTKANLQEASQKYCNESMTHTKPGT